MATLQLTARGLRIIPDTVAEELQIAAIGWQEGGDWLPLVRIDRQNGQRIRMLMVVRDDVDVDPANFAGSQPKELDVRTAEKRAALLAALQAKQGGG